jgi:hypothetical protein
MNDTCKPDDLMAGYMITEYWHADDTGRADRAGGFPYTSEAQIDGEPDEYKCDNCGEFFDTWQAAQDHLNDMTFKA